MLHRAPRLTWGVTVLRKEVTTMRARFAFHHPVLAVLVSPVVAAWLLIKGLYWTAFIITRAIAWVATRVRKS